MKCPRPHALFLLLILASSFAQAATVVIDGSDTLQLRRWYLHFGGVNAYPKMESEGVVDYFDGAMKLLAPGYDDVKTIGDLRDQHLLWPPQIGVGYVLSPRWVVAMQLGWSEGKVRTKDDDTSIFLLPLHTDFEIKRGAWFVGANLEFFPWKVSQQREYAGWKDRIKGTRPYVGVSLTHTYAWYRAKAKIQLRPFNNLGITVKDDWHVNSLNVHAGLDIPYNTYNGMLVNFGYNFFDTQKQDFEGYALSLEWRHFFR